MARVTANKGEQHGAAAVEHQKAAAEKQKATSGKFAMADTSRKPDKGGNKSDSAKKSR